MGALDVTPRDWTAGEVVTAAMLNAEIRDKWLATQAVWTPYTPVLTAATTNPVLGTGSQASSDFIQIGKTVHYKGVIKFGTSGATFGSGNYSISIPVNATGQTALGTIWASPAGGTVWPGVLRGFSASAGVYASASATAPALAAVSNTGVGGTAWAASGYFWWSITYQAA